jgi:hypothetical protein
VGFTPIWLALARSLALEFAPRVRLPPLLPF